MNQQATSLTQRNPGQNQASKSTELFQGLTEGSTKIHSGGQLTERVQTALRKTRRFLDIEESKRPQSSRLSAHPRSTVGGTSDSEAARARTQILKDLNLAKSKAFYEL